MAMILMATASWRMTMSHKNYQSNTAQRNRKSKDVFKRTRTIPLSEKLDKDRENNIKDWVTFYRNNIHRFIQHYMGVNLYPYQRIWVYLISQSTIFLGLASRASAKSWLIGAYTVAKCILYPGTIVSLSSSTKAQAGLIISEKIQSFYNDYPNVTREISNITTNVNKWEVNFHNGSKINVVISGESGRGHRSNICILEERRLIPSEIIDSIIRPFLVARTPPYMKDPAYSHLIEEPQEITISSVHYKSGEWFAEAKKRLLSIARGSDDVKAFFLDYLILLKHGIKTKKQMKNEKDTLDSITFDMEYGNIPFGGSSRSFYKLDFFQRSLKRAWIPIRLGGPNYVKGKNPYGIPRKLGEIRVVAIDVAAKGGSRNDNTVISCARLFPSKKGWVTEIVYVEVHSGENVSQQTLRIKQIFHEFCGFDSPDDVLVLDVLNVGIFLYDTLTTVTHDDERDIDYEPMTVMMHSTISDKEYDELSGRCASKDAVPCIYPISASAALNSEIASAFRTRLKSKLLRFLVDATTQEEIYIKKKNKDVSGKDPESRALLLSPNINTTLLINEAISLDMSLTGGENIKLVEPSGGRKDRYSSVSYLNYYVSLLDQELLKDDDDQDDLDSWVGAFGVV